jgi:hypothetical protein
MTEYIRLHRDGVGWWARYREYNLQDAYNLCTECRLIQHVRTRDHQPTGRATG